VNRSLTCQDAARPFDVTSIAFELRIDTARRCGGLQPSSARLIDRARSPIAFAKRSHGNRLPPGDVGSCQCCSSCGCELQAVELQAVNALFLSVFEGHLRLEVAKPSKPVTLLI
jgi:hypothetical protein